MRIEDAPAVPGDREGYLVIGNTTLSRRICQELAGGGEHVDHLVEPADDVLAEGVRRGPIAVAVVVHDDVVAVRYALATAHLDPTLRILVTIFDRTIADHVGRLLPQAVVTSPAGIAAPSLAGPCLGPDVVAAWLEAGPSTGSCRQVGTGSTTPHLARHAVAPAFASASLSCGWE